jgi:deoxyribodipyrimidine photo-lyase
MPALVWLTRDLRVHDHPALCAATDAHDLVVPVFCLDDRLLHGRHASGPRTRFMLECLSALDAALRQRGSRLVVRRARPEQALPTLARETGVTEVYCTADSGPFARDRAGQVRSALEHVGVSLRARPGLHAIDDLGALRTVDGRPYSVFSPFHRSWRAEPRRAVLAPPGDLPAVPRAIRADPLASPETLHLPDLLEHPPLGGEPEARRRLERFIAESIDGYAGARDLPAVDGTSRLSPYLHFGCVSPREIEERLPADESADAFRRQLCWRDFHHHVLLHHPGNATQEFQARCRDLPWRQGGPQFDAWCAGRTGYPFVDAGMRQLRREGWIHNRVRLVVGSFLTKNLGVDWRRGERWFMRWLVDGDEANNNGNWQWIASVGTDPQPPYRRAYSPVRHQQRLDADGVYVRRYVPELDGVPNEFLAEPWRMPVSVQHASGCVIGRDYPEPIVDHVEARREALDRYAAHGRARA